MPTEAVDLNVLSERVAARVEASGILGASWGISIGDSTVVGAWGHLDQDATAPVRPDSIFRLSSVSKPIVAVAALQLVESGRLGLDDPIDELLPELADRTVLTDPDGPLDQLCVPAERPLTLRDLLTFRCGWGMDFSGTFEEPHLMRLWELGVGPGPGAPQMPPEEYLSRLSGLPLTDQPGTRWRYHVGSDVLGVLIERAHGENLDVVLDREVLGPLCMADTAFSVTEGKRHRLGVSRTPREGEVIVWDGPDGRWSAPPEFRSGAAGLVSTAPDLVAFGQMLLRGGRGREQQVLSEPLVAEMTTDVLTDEQRRRARIDETGDSMGWGLGVGVVHHVAPGTRWPGPGSYGWDGGLGSRWLVDPEHQVCAVLLCTDGFEVPAVPGLLAEFSAEIGASLTA